MAKKYKTYTTTSGSCAGMPLAGVIYGLAMNRFLKLLNDYCKDNIDNSVYIKDGLRETKIAFNEVSFFDDVAIPIYADADNIVNKNA